MTGTINVTAYLQIEQDSRGYLRGRVARVTTKRPDPPLAGAVVVKLQIRVPRAAFEPLSPEVVVDIPESMTQHPIQITAEEPS
jgi:hypothetical protein